MENVLPFSTNLRGLQSYFQPSYTQTTYTNKNQDMILLGTIRELTYMAVVLFTLSQQ